MEQTHQDYVRVVADTLGLTIPPECMPGILHNLRLLLSHAAIVAAADDPDLDPAELLRP